MFKLILIAALNHLINKAQGKKKDRPDLARPSQIWARSSPAGSLASPRW
jgi:hypothetical protein